MNSLELLKTYGVGKLELQKTTSEDFSIPLPYINLLEKYFLLYWSGKYLKERLKNSSGLLRQDGVNYSVYLLHNLTLGNIKEDEFTQYALSFRVTRKEYELHPVVLISPSSQNSKGYYNGTN